MVTSRPIFRSLAGLVLGAALAFQASAQPASVRVAQIENYINGIDTLEADFSQIGPDGSLTTGKLFLDRPGLMRIDYDPPSRILMIAEDWRLIYYDGSIKQVTTIPLSKTPLSILLDEDVTLDGDVEVVKVEEGDTTFATTLIRSEEADQGSVTLSFNKYPLELVSWVVTDPQGYQTQLMLRDIKLGGKYERRLFHWRNPKLYGYPDEDEDGKKWPK